MQRAEGRAWVVAGMLAAAWRGLAGAVDHRAWARSQPFYLLTEP